MRLSRVLRMAAAVVVLAAIVVVVLPLIWWQAQEAEQSAFLHDTYLYVDTASTVGLLIGAAVAALILFAQARILERIDEIQGRSNNDD